MSTLSEMRTGLPQASASATAIAEVLLVRGQAEGLAAVEGSPFLVSLEHPGPVNALGDSHAFGFGDKSGLQARRAQIRGAGLAQSMCPCHHPDQQKTS